MSREERARAEDSQARGGLRDLDQHASWREVYSALACPTSHDRGGSGE